MTIAVVGNGKMGREVARAASELGIRVAATFDSRNNAGGSGLTAAALAGVDACIEFTGPASAVANIEAALRAGTPIIVGTTGWYDRLDAVRGAVGRSGGALVYAPNFSPGAALLGRLAAEAARVVNDRPEFDAAVRETHHRGKADSPSGTALRLARILLDGIARKTSIHAGSPEGALPPDRLQVSSLRVGEAVGEHAVIFDSPSESIEIIHRAKDRTAFARGALAAARWIRGRKGVFTMDDVLSGQ